MLRQVVEQPRCVLWKKPAGCASIFFVPIRLCFFSTSRFLRSQHSILVVSNINLCQHPNTVPLGPDCSSSKMSQPASTTPRPGTPPHHPIAGVSLPTSFIETIFKAVYPDSDPPTIEQLPSGRSYNNRIYFLTVPETPSTPPKRLVLKVNGRFFGPAKIQNEVACLRILQRYCPDLPVPRVIAWATSGRTVTFPSDADKLPKHPIPLPVEGDSQHPGWILMTRVPGEPLSSVSLTDSKVMDAVGAQLADMVATWRTKVPQSRHCGNLIFRPVNAVNYPEPDVDLRHNPTHWASSSQADDLMVRGLLGDDITRTDPISSVPKLHRVILQAKLHELQTKEIYAYTANRELAPAISEFITNTLPKVFRDNTPKFVFTHSDLSPRNVLVFYPEDTEGTNPVPPEITGIVDFEFSGFFTPWAEFASDYVNKGGDWPERVHSAYMQRLYKHGVRTPHHGFHEGNWAVEHELESLAENIAPWWLSGGYDHTELDEKLASCKWKVQQLLATLKWRASHKEQFPKEPVIEGAEKPVIEEKEKPRYLNGYDSGESEVRYHLDWISFAGDMTRMEV